MRLWGINTEFVGLFPRVSLWGLLFCWDWILIYRNWSILACKSVPAPAQPALTTSRSGVGNYIYPMIHHFEIYYQLWRTTWSSHFKMDANKDTPWQEEQFRIQRLLYFYWVDLSYVFQFTNVFVHLSLPSQQLSRAFQIGLKMYKETFNRKGDCPGEARLRAHQQKVRERNTSSHWMRQHKIGDQPAIYMGRVVQKPINTNPGLKVNQGTNFLA